MPWARVWAILAIAYGALLIVAACCAGMAQFQRVNSNSATGIAFVISAIFFTPFVMTYTQLGLNSAEGKESSPTTKDRHALLAQACPIWNVLWYGMIAVVMFAWVIAPLLSVRIHAFHAFSGSISLLSGGWFAFVYPTARNLFSQSTTGEARDG